ncbi:MAG: flagellar basal body P-ring protein FlgI [Sphingobium sp.]
MELAQKSLLWLIGVLIAALLLPSAAAAAPRIKDIVDIENVRPNQLIGYGLVVGLAGTGDKIRNAPFTEESMQAMLERMGVNVRASQMKTQNVAAVSVTATMPPFARTGSQIDVNVSALGDATSLQGGTLLITALKGMDGQIYAVAQGPVAVSGFKAGGAGANISRGVSTSARIASGAIIEREVPFALKSSDTLKLALRNPDFSTARRVTQVINKAFPDSAEMLDPSTVRLSAADGAALIDRIAQIENLVVEVDVPARVIVNEAAGTVVMTADVRVSPVAIAQGGLTISVAENPVASQPGPLSNGGTAVLPRTQVEVDDGGGASLAMVEGASLKTLVGGLNALGVSPRDLITILQALRTAGALQADIEVQ